MGEKLRPKYQVLKFSGQGLPAGIPMKSVDPDDIDSPFVLMPRKDPAAFRAMVCYARFCEPDLRAEIATWLDKIARAEPVFGTQGTRNMQEIRSEEIRLGL